MSSPEPESGERIGGRNADAEGQKRRSRSDDEAVDQRGGEAFARQNFPVGLEVGVGWNQSGIGKDIGPLFERNGERDQERGQGPD